jgi:hypothetical protein
MGTDCITTLQPSFDFFLTGAPHFGQFLALSLTSLPHSLHFKKLIRPPPKNLICFF